MMAMSRINGEGASCPFLWLLPSPTSPSQKVAPLLWPRATDQATVCSPTPHFLLVILLALLDPQPLSDTCPGPSRLTLPWPVAQRLPWSPVLSLHSPGCALTLTPLPCTPSGPGPNSGSKAWHPFRPLRPALAAYTASSPSCGPSPSSHFPASCLHLPGPTAGPSPPAAFPPGQPPSGMPTRLHSSCLPPLTWLTPACFEG